MMFLRKTCIFLLYLTWTCHFTYSFVILSPTTSNIHKNSVDNRIRTRKAPVRRTSRHLNIVLKSSENPSPPFRTVSTPIYDESAYSYPPGDKKKSSIQKVRRIASIQKYARLPGKQLINAVWDAQLRTQ